ncbi:MAG: GldG family protein [Clostridia bacterium]|nr:GldG family protein [Clostridia bacterium]
MKNIKKMLLDGTTTCALVLIIVSVFILINLGMQKLDLTPIDLTPGKTYTLTNESKDKISNIEKQVNIYLIGYTDDDTTTVLAKQYNKSNSNINVEAINITQRTDLAQKYGIDSNETSGIIVECGEKYKVLTANDLTSYDMTTYESTDVTEEKLTSSILTVTADKIPNVYFLTGYSDFSLEGGMSYLAAYLENETMKVNTLDLVAKGNVPDDCDALIITTPNKDFADVVSNAIIKYINKGGNILWLNSSYGTAVSLPNVNKVLAIYGVNPFNTGYIMETDANKMITNAPYMVLPDVEYADVTSKTSSILFLEPTKLNIQEESKLTELKVEKTDLLKTSEKSFFRTDIKQNSLAKTDSDTAGNFLVGAKLTKTIKDDTKSILIIYGDNYFVSNTTVMENSTTPILLVYDNKDLVLNSMAVLTDRDEDITIRKSTDIVQYTATQTQDVIIRIIIFVIPCLIIIAGIVVWQLRRRKK